MGLGDITYSCNVISPSDTGGVMARWIRFRGRKVIKHHGLIFLPMITILGIMIVTVG